MGGSARSMEFKYGLSLYKRKGIVNQTGAIPPDYEIMRRAEPPLSRPRPQRPRRERRYSGRSLVNKIGELKREWIETFRRFEGNQSTPGALF
jgi:hypothetical protein